jgi:hypothetical protein
MRAALPRLLDQVMELRFGLANGDGGAHVMK